MIAEKESTYSSQDNNMKKLISTCKNLQEYLLSYANYKPTKKDSNSLEKTSKLENSEISFKALISKIMEFK